MWKNPMLPPNPSNFTTLMCFTSCHTCNHPHLRAELHPRPCWRANQQWQKKKKKEGRNCIKSNIPRFQSQKWWTIPNNFPDLSPQIMHTNLNANNLKMYKWVFWSLFPKTVYCGFSKASIHISFQTIKPPSWCELLDSRTDGLLVLVP